MRFWAWRGTGCAAGSEAAHRAWTLASSALPTIEDVLGILEFRKVGIESHGGGKILLAALPVAHPEIGHGHITLAARAGFLVGGLFQVGKRHAVEPLPVEHPT